MKKIASLLIAISIISPSYADEWDVIFVTSSDSSDSVWFAVNRSTNREISGFPVVWTVKGATVLESEYYMLDERMYECNSHKHLTLRSYFIEGNGFTPSNVDKKWADSPIPGTFLKREVDLVCGKIKADFRIRTENTIDLPKLVRPHIGK